MNTKIIITLNLLILLLSACGGGKSTTSTPIVQPPITDNTRLKRSVSDNALEQSIKKLMLATYGKIAEPHIMPSVAEMGASADASSTYSSTNTQEANVDEADRLKNDASYLYVASSKEPSINIYSTLSGDAVLSSTMAIATENSQLISGLYLKGNQLIALSGDNRNFWDVWFDINHWNDRSTQLDFFTTAEGTLSKSHRLSVDGQLISSRRIGDTLYFATRHTPSLKGLKDYPESDQDVEKNRVLIESASLADFLPNYRIDGESNGDILSASNCFTTAYTGSENQQISIINVLSIDLNNSTAKPKGTCFIGAAEAVYVSSESLYLATTQYNYQTSNNTAIYNPNITTDIHKFTLDDGTVTYKGSAQVAGHLGWKQASKSFRMGEFNNVLGIITYTGNNAGSNASPAKLFMLKEDDNKVDTLKILSTLPNNKRPEKLGKPGEQIYATRFLGNKAYLVTFRTTDPLYILDLSDPSDPFVAGELEINGYSDYLHPIGDDLLLGIGKDAIPAKSEDGISRGAWYQGVKLSLFDISNPQDPITRFQSLIGSRGTNTAVSHSHHAFTSLLQENGDLRISLPVRLHENDMMAQETAPPNVTHEWEKDALYRYTINTITGDMTKLYSIKSPSEESFSTDWRNHRSAIINDKVYYLHGDDVISSDW